MRFIALAAALILTTGCTTINHYHCPDIDRSAAAEQFECFTDSCVGMVDDFGFDDLEQEARDLARELEQI